MDPLPASLTTALLACLIPQPNVPLPPDLLSTALLQRHHFLPPTLDEPLAHFSLLSSDPATLHEIGHHLDGVSRQMGEAEHPSLNPGYWLPDQETLLARVDLYASPPSPDVGPSLALTFVYEGEGKGWRFYDLTLAAVRQDEPWRTSLEEAIQLAEAKRATTITSTTSMSAAAETADDNAEGGGVVANEEDFWGGYSSDSDDDGVAAGLTRKGGEPAAPLSTDGGDGDDYWSRYGTVDDGVAPSAPATPAAALKSWPSRFASSPKIVEPGSSPAISPPSLEEVPAAWGTGGESPVRLNWTSPLPSSEGTSSNAPSAGLSSLSANGTNARRHPLDRSASGSSDPGSMPVFPPPPFKGATPSTSPALLYHPPPSQASGIPSRHRLMFPNHGELQTHSEESLSSSSSAPSPPRSPASSSSRRKRTTTALKTSGSPTSSSSSSSPAAPASSSSPPPSNDDEATSRRATLKLALASFYQMYLLTPGLTPAQAAADFLAVAGGVVAEEAYSPKASVGLSRSGSGQSGATAASASTSSSRRPSSRRAAASKAANPGTEGAAAREKWGLLRDERGD